MFDIGAAELLVLVIVAVLVIGPKDMPLALRTAGKWLGKIRRVSTHFRTGLDAMIREAELEDMEKKWKAQNEAIMAKSSADTPADPKFSEPPAPESGPETSRDDPQMTGRPVQTAEDRAAESAAMDQTNTDHLADDPAPRSEPELPLGGTKPKAKSKPKSKPSAKKDG